MLMFVMSVVMSWFCAVGYERHVFCDAVDVHCAVDWAGLSHARMACGPRPVFLGPVSFAVKPGRYLLL